MKKAKGVVNAKSVNQCPKGTDLSLGKEQVYRAGIIFLARYDLLITTLVLKAQSGLEVHSTKTILE
jgi:hypothetical protein